MIFVTVGTQFSFDRLILAVDQWAGRHRDEKVVGQIGPGDYKPSFIEAHPFISPDLFQQYQSESQLLISHAGMGAVLGALEGGKPLIIMPRKASLGEHRNDHQLATARHFRGTAGIHVADDSEQLNQLLERRFELSVCSQINTSASSELVGALEEFLNAENQKPIRAPAK